MKVRALGALGAVLALGVGALGATPARAEGLVDVPDAALRACIAARLDDTGRPSDFTAENLAGITDLPCYSSDTPIADLSGVEHLVGLERLVIYGSEVADVTPVASLTGLSNLQVQSSLRYDLSPMLGLPSLTKLMVTVQADADGALLGQFAHVNKLYVHTSQTRMPSLTIPAAVTELDLAGDRLEGFSPVSGGGSVTEFYSSGRSLASLDGLEGLARLQKLSVGWSSVSDISAVAGMTKLEEAHLSFARLSDVTPLRNLPDLRVLDLRANRIGSLEGLTGLGSLAELDVSGNRLVDLAGTDGLPGLRKLTATDNQLAGLEPVAAMTGLESLDISRNAVTDVSPLAALTHLATLSMRDNQVADLAPLTGLEALRGLDATANHVTTLGPPGGFSRLTSVSLTGNDLTSIEALRGARLVRVGLGSNRIPDVAPLADIEPNATVDLSGNRLRDLSPLPDTVTYYATAQQLTFPEAVVGLPMDLGVRGVAGQKLCPTYTPSATCTEGVVTFPASGTYHAWLGDGGSAGHPAFSFWLDQHAGPERDFARTYAPTVGNVPLVGYSVQPRYRQWSPRPADYTYQWYRDQRPIPGDAGREFNYTVVADDLGHRLSVCVTGRLDGFSARTRCSRPSTTVRKGDVWFTGRPKVTGTPVTDATLTATAAAWIDGVTFHYQWQRNGRNIPGASTTTYAVRPADVGQRIRVRVKGTGAGLNPVTEYSRSLTVHKAPLATVVPTVSGEPKAGATLQADPGTWGPSPVTLAFQWYRGSSAIARATASSYVLNATDLGGAITVRVTGRRPGYSTASRSSLPIGPITAP